jgi:hypothetical protein
MRLVTFAIPVFAGCALYTGHGQDPPAPPPEGTTPADYHQLVVDHTVGAEDTIRGVDADQQGGLWLAYSAPPAASAQRPIVSLVHWDPATRTRLQTFTYDDLASPVSGLALVQGQIWLNYEHVGPSDAVVRIIDPTSGAVVRTLGTTGLALGAMGSDRVLISGYAGIQVVDAATGGQTQQFHSPTVVDPGDMGGISFSDTEQGVASRPGEIWVANWYMAMEVFDPAGTLLGKVDLAALQDGAADPMHYLAFDRGQLLVGVDGQLTWYDVR